MSVCPGNPLPQLIRLHRPVRPVVWLAWVTVVSAAYTLSFVGPESLWWLAYIAFWVPPFLVTALAASTAGLWQRDAMEHLRLTAMRTEEILLALVIPSLRVGSLVTLGSPLFALVLFAAVDAGRSGAPTSGRYLLRRLDLGRLAYELPPDSVLVIAGLGAVAVLVTALILGAHSGLRSRGGPGSAVAAACVRLGWVEPLLVALSYGMPRSTGVQPGGRILDADPGAQIYRTPFDLYWVTPDLWLWFWGLFILLNGVVAGVLWYQCLRLIERGE